MGIAALLVTACGGGDADDDAGPPVDEAADQGRDTVVEGAPEYGGNLVVAVSAETNGWTPQTNQFADAGSLVIASVVEGMAMLDENNQPVPLLAESWESNPDFTQWTVHLREGIEFHDGEPLDAAAAIVNIEAAVASPLSGLALSPLVDTVEEVEGDDMSFVVNLKRPWSAFPRFLAGQSGMLVSPKMFEEDSFGALHPVGTGAFVFDEWIQDDRFVAVANDNYWRTAANGDKLPYLESIEFRVIVDGAARAAALESGDVDLMYTIRAPDIEDFRENEEVTLIEDKQSEETYVQLNQAIPPFDNIHARRAAAMAIDSFVIAESLGEGITEPIDQPWAENNPYYNPDAGYVEFDVEAARAEVELYRQDTGEEELSFVMKGLNSIDDAQLLQLLEQMWNEAGIEAELQTVEQTTFITDMAFGNFQASYLRGFADTHPDAYYVFLHSDYANYDEGVSINFTNTKNPEIDALLDETREVSTDNHEVWDGNLRDIVPILNEELPYIWLFRTPHALVANADVGGLNVPREAGFGNLEQKWWVTELWLRQ